MKCSVIVRSLNEADRLRLTLYALEQQSEPCEVVVVNDGSTDHTSDVISEFHNRLALKVVHHDVPRGRSFAANAGSTLAGEEIILFLDGDVLLCPQAVAAHMALHRQTNDLMVRGSQFHLRGTRFLLNPETGSPMPGQETRVARMSADELDRCRITAEQVLYNFDAIIARARPSIYPGAGPERLYEIEMDAIARYPDCPVLWAAASGHNFSVPRRAFMDIGGTDPVLDQNDHREMALSLSLAGLRMSVALPAESYHLTHRTGWRNPLEDTRWEQVFYFRHPILAVKLLSVFWAGLSDPSPVPEKARIHTLPDLAEAATGARGIDYDMIRRLIPNLQDLSATA